MPALESADEAAWLAAERRRVQNALDRLPESLRQVLELAYYGGLTQSEIAKRLDIPLGTVKSRTSTALTRLRCLLVEESGAPDGSSTRQPECRSEALECAAVGA
jgi:RNA polymerase sigma-70 factor (ECF subfamily)